MVKNPPPMQETWVQSLGWDDPLENGMATHSSILAWRIHGQRSLVGYSTWGCKELDMTEQLSTAQHMKSKEEKMYMQGLYPHMHTHSTQTQNSQRNVPTTDPGG